MKKPNKRDSLNLVFSAFLILGYIVCSYFFLTMAESKPDLAPFIKTLVFVAFGLIVFYATRVGEGKPIKRFSLWTLLLLDLPAVYAILAQFSPSMPLHQQIAYLDGAAALSYSPLFILACIALGYGIPYTFFSGFETEEADELTEETSDEEAEALEYDFEEESAKKYILCEEDTEGALLIVDDLDTAFDKEKEIRLSDVTPCDDEIKVGSFVVCTEENEYTESDAE